MDITIREVEEKDYSDELSIWNSVFNCKHTIEKIIAYYDKIKNDERYKTFVAVLDNEVVGVCSSVQSITLADEVGFIHLIGIAVKNEMQNKGIGTKLLKYLEEYAKEKGVNSILLNTGIQRTDAHRFYKRHGYDNHSWCFSKKL